MSEIVKCPNCGHEFNSDETFEWMPDENGHPTIEKMSCPKCYISTHAWWNCDLCPIGRAGKCNLEEECDATISCKFDDFKVVPQQ